MKLKTLLVGAVAGLLLTACGGGSSPEDVTKSFVEALASGDCEKAMGMAVETAKETVQGTIDAGCEKYESEITSVTCETTEETAACECAEKRDAMDMTYTYDLKKVDGEWKVAAYSKKMDMGDMNMGE